MSYQHQLTPLKKRIYELEQKLEKMANEELSELLPGLYNRLATSEFLSFNDVLEFLV
jgi:hypothetical protein